MAPTHKEKQNATVEKVDDLTERIQSLGLLETKDKPDEAKDDDSASPSVRRVARWFQEGNAKNILVLSGAGVSCSAGIPDFRTPGTGLYDNLQKYNLPYPEAVFDLKFYQRNPKPFCSLAKEIWPGLKHSPTLTHTFLALLAKKGRLLRNYSQNIDGLEVLASIPAEQVVECHGHFRTASCIRCNKDHDGDECKKTILEQDTVPKCKSCGGHVKPDIVFFGEDLPDRYSRLLRKDLGKADLLLIMGTSLMVAPVSLIPQMIGKKCKRVLVNRELVGNLDVDDEDGRDVWLGGDCDDSVMELCRILGWEQELMALNKSTRITPKGGKRK